MHIYIYIDTHTYIYIRTQTLTLDVKWEHGSNYAAKDGLHSDEDIQIFRQHLSRVKKFIPSTDFTSQGTAAVQNRYDITHVDDYEEYETSYSVLQKKLINHFNGQYFRNEVQWLQKKPKSK